LSDAWGSRGRRAELCMRVHVTVMCRLQALLALIKSAEGAPPSLVSRPATKPARPPANHPPPPAHLPPPAHHSPTTPFLLSLSSRCCSACACLVGVCRRPSRPRSSVGPS
jgi:hypothetical protein